MILTGSEMYVHADKGKIQQVLYNLKRTTPLSSVTMIL